MAGDPAIRWQVLRDLLDRPDAEVRRERAHVSAHRRSRVAEAMRFVVDAAVDGRWSASTTYPGEMLLDRDDGVGQPSRWLTLRALRVRRWHATTA